LEGYHGDNCGTVLIGDQGGKREKFDSDSQELLFITGRRLIRAAKEALDTAIETCRPGSCLTEVGNAINAVTDAYGYSSVEKYRGHGIGRDFHCPPFVKHYRNNDVFRLEEGMVFTIEPMVTEGRSDCAEWQSDGWTVVTRDKGRAAQFEHMVAITDSGAEVLTLPSNA
jgi:methionyl aminopeptidase